MIRTALIVLATVMFLFPMNTFGGSCCNIQPSMEKEKCLEGDCKNGKGVLIKPDGTRYEGEFKDDLPNGKGIFIYPKKEAAKKGTYTFRNSGKYEGDVKQGIKQGRGTFTFITGTKYVGQFEDDKMKKGLLTMSNGTVYEGEFDNDMPSGNGTVIFSDGRKYAGEIKTNNISGNGEMTFPDGRKYVGMFHANKMQGQGIMTYSDGKKEEGIFIDDKFVGKEPPVVKSKVQKDNSKSESNIERMRRCAEKAGIGTRQETKNYMKMTPEQFIEQMNKENRIIPMEEIEKRLGGKPFGK